MVTNAGVSCSVHTWNDNLRVSLPHLNAVVTSETCSVYVAYVACLYWFVFNLGLIKFLKWLDVLCRTRFPLRSSVSCRSPRIHCCTVSLLTVTVRARGLEDTVKWSLWSPNLRYRFLRRNIKLLVYCILFIERCLSAVLVFLYLFLPWK